MHHRALLLALSGLLFVALSAPQSLRAQQTKAAADYSLTVRTDHANAIYKQGEPVTFTIQLVKRGQPVAAADISWTLSKDGVAPIKSEKLTLKDDGTGTITGRLDEPGFLQLRLTFNSPEKTPITALGGAAIDPLQIKPSLPVPDDFDEFWAVQKKALAAVAANPRLTSVPSLADGIESFDLQADSVGAPVSGYLARPKDAKPKSLPITLLVHGAGVRSASLGSAVNWAKQGFLALDLNAHGIPNGKPDAFYTELSAGELKDYRNRGNESRDTIYFRGMFLRLVRALDVLTAQPEWDGRTVVVQGSSQGGAQALVAAGLDPRVTFFAAGVPAMCDHTGVAVGRINGWPKMVPNGPDGKPNAKSLEVARYYDAMNFATRIKAPGIITVGFIDTTCPPTGVYATYNNLTVKKEIFNDILAGHTNTPQASQAMSQAIRAYVAASR